jgi:hypothetical protein
VQEVDKYAVEKAITQQTVTNGSSRALDSQMEAYSQALLLSLTAMMHAMLPAELRDYVYENLLDRVAHPRFNLWLSHDKMPKNMWESKPAVFPWTYTAWKKPFHYENSEFVGSAFAKELISMYYRRTTFTIPWRCIRILDTFLKQDPYGHGVVSHNIRYLDIYFHFDRFGESPSFIPPYAYEIDAKKVQAAAIATGEKTAIDLAPLTQLQRQCRVKIQFGVWVEAAGLYQFQQMASALCPIVTTLEEIGCKVEVRVDRYHKQTREGCMCVGHWNLNDSGTQLSAFLVVITPLRSPINPCLTEESRTTKATTLRTSMRRRRPHRPLLQRY